MPFRTIIGNIVMFQVGWLACVMGGARGLAWAGAAVACVVVAWHLARSPRRGPEALLIAVLVGVGFAFDSLLAASGLVSYNSAVPWPQLAPVWIVALWACFATTLNVSLRWMRDRPSLIAVFGAVGGPLAYLGGAGIGAVTFGQPLAALAALSVGWSILMLAALPLARRLDGWNDAPARAPRLAAGQA
jgi:hypothetical protein